MTTKTVSPYKTTLDAGNAYWMAKLAGFAYIRKDEPDVFPDEATILAELKEEDPNFLSVEGFSENSSQAILVEHTDFLTMAFRGTDELRDWRDNLELVPQKVLLCAEGEGEGQVFGYFHKGFQKATEDIWKPIFQKYQEFQKQDLEKRNQEKAQGQKPSTKTRTLFLTGHSLGGAMATIAAAKLISEDIPFISAYTFGQPRVMTHKTAQFFDTKAKARFFRFQNNNDLVTRAPSRSMNYSHVGSYLYIAEDQKLYNDIGFWYRFLDTMEGVIDAIPEKGLDAVEDHNMADYLDAVTKWDCPF